MCGIWAAFGSATTATPEVCKTCLETLHARGPEESRLEFISGDVVLGFTRLAINGLNPLGMQPMHTGSTYWITNGEIYNWRELATVYALSTTSGSDCEVVGRLLPYFQTPASLGGLFRALDGVFATILVDTSRNWIVVARDPYGVRPLFWGHTPEGGLVFGSELKSLTAVCETNRVFEPGTYTVYDLKSLRPLHSESYHTLSLVKLPSFKPFEKACQMVRGALVAAVQKRMLTERPVAALLSGGIDSSLIASLVAAELRRAGAPPLRTFSIGMNGSEDLRYARKVAAWIQSDHTEVVLTANDFFHAIPEVIHDIESYDTTTVRASVGNWLVAREIKRTSDCKVVFNGDGSDEVFGSYLYFFNAPSDFEYEAEIVRLLKQIHTFDVLRSDRCISSHGLEARTPFLDKAFVQTVLSIPIEYRRPLKGARQEKMILREAFNDETTLPRDVLQRKKEAFSDGVSGTGASWYQQAASMAAEAVVQMQLPETLTQEWGVNLTPEQTYYRALFERRYRGQGGATVPEFWMPRWCEGATDPSARTLAVYETS